MAMSGIIGIINIAQSLGTRNDDDIVDRLHYRYTTTIMLVFSLVVSMTHWVGKTITCWAPKHFSGSWVTYTNQYCWVQNTYRLPYDEHIPKQHEEKSYVVYYQWVAFTLLFQALLFVLPITLWRMLSSHSGLDTGDIVKVVEEYDNSVESKDARKEKLRKIVERFELYQRNTTKFLRGHRSGYDKCCDILKSIMAKTAFCLVGKTRGSYIVMVYLFIKVLFFVNCVGQLMVLNWLLGVDFIGYGVSVIKTWMDTGEMAPDPRFPRVTFCDFHVRFIGNVQRYTVQCVLPINLYIEKVYLVMWFWLVFLAIVTIINFLSWLLRSVMKTDQKRFIDKHLDMVKRYGKVPENDPKRMNRRDDGYDNSSQYEDKMKKFVKTRLHMGVVFNLRLIEHNSNPLTVADIVYSMWRHFLLQEKRKETWEPNETVKPDDEEDAYEPATYATVPREEEEEEKEKEKKKPITPSAPLPPTQEEPDGDVKESSL